MDKPDYRPTLALPETDFPMKANLPKREPEQISKWLDNRTYDQIQKANDGKPPFVMPDGPPYANGNIHIGHCLNKILKDFVVKYKAMKGHQSVFIPGWDCHGLPIEHAVAKQLGKKRREKSDKEIRDLCRDYAGKFVETQKEQFIRLGILADWDNPYRTMDSSYESAMIKSLAKIFEKGHVYRGKKPVHWCWSDGTALAEAEVEYQNRKDPSIFVKFEATKNLSKLQDPDKKTYFVIWTTTPWTLPANLAICLGPDFDYGLYEVDGENWVVAEKLADNLQKLTGKTFSLKKSFKGSELAGTQKCDDNFDGVVCQHPFAERPSYVILGDHVTLETGSGCVHTAPGHGQEDYQVGLTYGLDTYCPVNNWGKFTEDVPQWTNKKVFDANPLVIEHLRDSGHLVHHEEFEHSYAHCWRCHNPIIYRATAQWFIAMDGDSADGSIRQNALKAIEEVKWIPQWGQNRITSMVQNRPDWCISRQRLWGVPIPVFYCTKCEEPLISPKMMNQVADKVAKEGLESWYTSSAQDFDPQAKCQCGNTEFTNGKDILDVWFDSGVCHQAVQEQRKGLTNPADLYLEGSDQHRGWFQSSLLTGIAINKEAPFRAILTHGFVNDAKGRKMSKSLGNVIDAVGFVNQSGAEVLRLWTAYEDYSNDLQAGKESFDRVSESYRRVRNTCRYILGNLHDFDPEKESVAYKDLLEIDQWALGRLSKFIKTCETAYENYEYHRIYHALQNYCTVDLSSVYLDILKDRLYTAKKDGLPRKSAQTTIFLILKSMTGVITPILSFLAEEVYGCLPGPKKESVFLTDFPQPVAEWENEAVEAKWSAFLEVRSVVMKELEEARKEKLIGSALEAKVDITAPDKTLSLLESMNDLKSLFIVSKVNTSKGDTLSVSISKAPGEKCERCWVYDEQTGENSSFPQTCPKCVEALS